MLEQHKDFTVPNTDLVISGHQLLHDLEACCAWAWYRGVSSAGIQAIRAEAKRREAHRSLMLARVEAALDAGDTLEAAIKTVV